MKTVRLFKEVTENLIYYIDVVAKGYRMEITESCIFNAELDVLDEHVETNTLVNVVSGYKKLGYKVY